MTSIKEQEYENILRDAIEQLVFPGCAFLAIDQGDVYVTALGSATYEKDSAHITPDTLYDVASISKIVGPMSVAMMLVGEGVLDLDEKLVTYLPEFGNQSEKQMATIAHALTYTLEYDIPDGAKSLLYTLLPSEVANNAITYQLRGAPGSIYRYSNITAFLVTQVIERVTRRSFYELVVERVFLPLGMSTATFAPTKDQIPMIPPTELVDGRGLVQGFVHDEFTDRLTQGGIACGAAGLFASVKDLQPFLEMAIARGVYKEKRLFSEKITAGWTTDQFPHLLPTHTPLGWGDNNNGFVDQYHSEIVVKAGFTGCFMFADIANQRGFVVLSNRTYPQRPVDASAFAEVTAKLVAVTEG